MGKLSVLAENYLNDIRYFSYPAYTRVVIDLSESIKIDEKLLPGNDAHRLYFDLKNCRIGKEYPAEKTKLIKVELGNLQQIRIGRPDADTIRIVFDFKKIDTFNKFYLSSPHRIVFDIFQQEKKERTIPVTTHQPKSNTDKNTSMIRQLGLKVHNIIIDPGHGGSDPGAINQTSNLLEKNITLEIAKNLKQIFSKHPEYKIILTREDDRYLSLEERTALANSNNGDLFISIHLNSAARKSAKGLETYYLSCTTDPWAINVAAQENFMSEKSIGEMKTILEKILQNSTITESKLLADLLQKKAAVHLSEKYDRIVNLGVKKAPFVVLAGAQMPAVLFEASFISNPDEALRLQRPSYIYSISYGLYCGIISYIMSLGAQ
jgi:N-acetylmuramoyl-L-alanine amidase